ncbi:MAG: DNA-directed RNA polymerase subunit E'' [Candidatus Micrarchaeota archaeon]|nr:DNA-directed RNA polymerase subunit E'' [Candidatus Micrarchaeota archaeon]
MPEQACRLCRRLVAGNLCPACRSNDLTRSWKGILVVFDTSSEMAKEAGLSSPGKYAVKVR